MSDEGFPLPGSSYAELSKIIAGYSESSAPANPTDISKICGVSDTQVSRNNKFLVAIGIVSGGQKKVPTELGKKLGRAIHFEQSEIIVDCWRDVCTSADFLQRIVSAIRIRKGMEEGALLSHIVFTSGATKSGFASAGAGAIIEILKLALAVREEGGTFHALDTPQEKPSSGSPLVVPLSSEDEKTPDLPSLPRVGEHEGQLTNTTLTKVASSLSINLTITCTPAEIEGLGLRLRNLLEEFGGRVAVTSQLTSPISPVESSASTDELSAQ